MATAARPTFEPARRGRGKGEGDFSQLSKQYSGRDLPSHTKIKYRQTTQDAPEEVRNRDFRRELEERERAAAREKNRDRPTQEYTTSSSVSKKPRLDQIPPVYFCFLTQSFSYRRMFCLLFSFRWDDDVVFKNCAKGVDDQKKDKIFVNDTLRSEFHKKFMEKYIK
uniref:Spliceosome-associated protein CWC15 homolog n=1 Tax=Panthera tigris altaica TaxID=74533 RepID=A0A8C9JI73_PANTA